MTGYRGYVMQDQVRELVRELTVAEQRRAGRRAALRRLVELGGLAVTGGLSAFVLVWPL